MAKFDFSGYATKNDIKCADGRVIRRDAFKACDGETVPLVWAHNHDDPEYVLGHAILENREDGVYTYGCFNNTPKGQLVKEMVAHGDITKMSIYANQLKQRGSDVIHGIIREVSLVQAGANPGAVIENLCFAHSDGTMYDSDEDAIIYTDNDTKLEMYHEDTSNEVEESSEPESNDSTENDEIEHADNEGEDKMAGKTVGDVIKTMNDDQKKVLFGLIGAIAAKKGTNKIDVDDEDEDDDVKHYDIEGETFMKYNVFETDAKSRKPVITHDEEKAIVKDIIEDMKQFGSLKKSVEFHLHEGAIAHSGLMHDDDPQTYGIQDIDWLFPDYKNLENEPPFIARDQKWVSVFMNGTKKTPFTHIKTMFADITANEARAKGYIKGDKKIEEVFTLVRRTVDPQTIYKLQRLDRDDILDITSFSAVRYIKSEMQVMIREEVARAGLIGDGKDPSDRTHISHDHVIPIALDDEFYTIPVEVTEGDSDDETCRNFIRGVIKARKDYKGSGSLTMYIKADRLSDLLLMTDATGRDLYESEAQLAKKLRVKEIVECPVLDDSDFEAVIVDNSDYTYGSNKGGELTLFDDFDIEYNQERYLIETRVSGMLIKPYSAMAVTVVAANSEG